MKNPQAKIINVEQGTKEWLQERKGKITSTLSYKIKNGVTQSNYDAFIGVSGFKGNYHTERGKRGEEQMRDFIIARDKLKLTTPTVVDGNFMASLDGITECFETIYEFKCPASDESKTYKNAQQGFADDSYFWQMQHALMVTGAKRCIYVVGLMSEDSNIDYSTIIEIEVFPHPATIQAIQANASEFLEQVKDFKITLPDWHEQIAKEYLNAKQKAEEWKKEAELLSSKLKELGSHKGNGVTVSVTKGHKKIDWKKVAIEMIDAYKGEYPSNMWGFCGDVIKNNTTTGADRISIRTYDDKE